MLNLKKCVIIYLLDNSVKKISKLYNLKDLDLKFKFWNVTEFEFKKK